MTRTTPSWNIDCLITLTKNIDLSSIVDFDIQCDQQMEGKTILIRKPYKTNKNISRLFYILMMIIFVWFIGIQILGPDEQFLTNLDIPSSTMVLLHGRNPMAQNKTFLFLDVIKFQQNRQ